jgi:hypothetical protein
VVVVIAEIIYEIDPSRMGCGYTTLREPEPKVHVNLYGVFAETLLWDNDCSAACQATIDAFRVETFVEHLVRTIDHELVHLICRTVDEVPAFNLEEAGSWARDGIGGCA